MISDYAKFEKNGLKVEVNWNDSVKPCKQIKITAGAGEVILDNKDFFSMVLLFGTADQGAMVTTVKKWELQAITRLLHVKLKKDMKEGQLINFPFTYFVPKELTDKVDEGGTTGNERLDRDIIERRKVDAVKVSPEAYPQKFGET